MNILNIFNITLKELENKLKEKDKYIKQLEDKLKIRNCNDDEIVIDSIDEVMDLFR
ncbi:archaellum biogenesis ATPase FlaH [Clostridium moniliforme]|uniref:Archaellum biogenesis ATPase FlaH n=1 Tax=Clostridium moniliforme TaxID=39489 RepID=A0ABS4F0J7_9CLOT|nr:hypothetical protein [Clostridium moniliforme]MBP1889774.1 archaellum biogenesis ATPase FlaH [Clostridium moniliforme]